MCEDCDNLIDKLRKQFGADKLAVFQEIGEDVDTPSCLDLGKDHDLEMMDDGSIYKCRKCKRKFMRVS